MMIADKNIRTLSDKDFNRLKEFIYKTCGINLIPSKKQTVQNRLLKIIQKSDFKNYTEYLDFALNNKEAGATIIELIDVLTTNKTDFYREPAHYDFLKNILLPKLYAEHKSLGLKYWSAGCSSGAEAFTTAIILEEFKQSHPNFDYFILATDISTKILQMAKRAIYTMQEVEVIPMELKRKYLLKSKDSSEKLVRMIPELRQKIDFRYLNLIDPTYDVKQKFDLIMCRNVLIYFDHKTRESIIKKLCGQLKHGAILMLGHSESIHNINVPLKQVQPSVFEKI